MPLPVFTIPEGGTLWRFTMLLNNYPLTRHDYKNHSLRLIFRLYLRGDFVALKSPGKKGFFKELRVTFVAFAKIMISVKIIPSNSLVLEGRLPNIITKAAVCVLLLHV